MFCDCWIVGWLVGNSLLRLLIVHVVDSLFFLLLLLLLVDWLVFYHSRWLWLDVVVVLL
jgi:hypothetical protein